MRKKLGFTLAELLVALAILGVIATFAIPKVLQSQRNDQHRAAAKEIIAAVSGAYQTYKLSHHPSSNTGIADLTPYLNYVTINTSLIIDDVPPSGADDCGAANRLCLITHSGAVIFYRTNESFGDTDTTNAIWFQFDPDGVYTNPADGNTGKSLQVFIYYNGRVSTRGTHADNTQNSTTTWPTADPAKDPNWFSWD